MDSHDNKGSGGSSQQSYMRSGSRSTSPVLIPGSCSTITHSTIATVALILNGISVQGWIVGSDADIPDIEKGMVVTHVDGRTVSSDTVSSMLSGACGSVVNVTLQHPGTHNSINVVLKRQTHGFSLAGMKPVSLATTSVKSGTGESKFQSSAGTLSNRDDDNNKSSWIPFGSSIDTAASSSVLHVGGEEVSERKMQGLKDELDRLGSTMEIVRDSIVRSNARDEELDRWRQEVRKSNQRVQQLETRVETLQKELVAAKTQTTSSPVKTTAGKSPVISSPYSDTASSKAVELEERVTNLQVDLKRMIQKLQSVSPVTMESHSSAGVLVTEDGQVSRQELANRLAEAKALMETQRAAMQRMQLEIEELQRSLQNAIAAKMMATHQLEVLEKESRERGRALFEDVESLEQYAINTARDLAEANNEVLKLRARLRQLSMVETSGSSSSKIVSRPATVLSPAVAAVVTESSEQWKAEIDKIRKTLADSQRALGQELSTSNISREGSGRDLSDSVGRIRHLREDLDRSLVQEPIISQAHQQQSLHFLTPVRGTSESLSSLWIKSPATATSSISPARVRVASDGTWMM